MGQIHGSGIGDWANTAQVTNNNELKTLPTDFRLDIARGNVEGMTAFHKFGRNTDIDTAASEDIWDGGGLYPFPTTGSPLAIVSSNAADISGTGVGLHTIAISGLDMNYVPLNENLELNGTTAVSTTAGSYFRLYRMVGLTGGASGTNIGSIVATHTTVNIGQISAERGQTLMAIHTISSGMTAYLTNGWASLLKKTAATADFTFFVRSSGGIWNTKLTGALKDDGTTEWLQPFNPPLAIPSMSDMRVEVATSANNTDVSAGFDMILVEE